MLLSRGLDCVLIVCFASQLLGTRMMAHETEPPTISVSGSAEVRVVPDHAVLRFSIDSRAIQLAAAVADNDAKVAAVTQYLEETPLERTKIRTELIRIQPIFDTPSKSPYPQQSAASAAPSVDQKIQPVGYSAKREISITIDNLDAFETIYRGLIERGVNEVDNLTFHSSQLRKHRDEARLLAIRAAREKAHALAVALGCRLAAVQSIRETNPGWRGSNMLQNRVSVAAGEVSDAVASGMITIAASVDVVFVLGDVELSD